MLGLIFCVYLVTISRVEFLARLILLWYNITLRSKEALTALLYLKDRAASP